MVDGEIKSSLRAKLITSKYLWRWKAIQVFLELFPKFIFFPPLKNFLQDVKLCVKRCLSIDKASQEHQYWKIATLVATWKYHIANCNFYGSPLATFSSPVRINPGRKWVREGFDNQRGKNVGLPKFQEDFDKVFFILLHGTLQEISQFTHICAVHLNKQCILFHFCMPRYIFLFNYSFLMKRFGLFNLSLNPKSTCIKLHEWNGQSKLCKLWIWILINDHESA